MEPSVTDSPISGRLTGTSVLGMVLLLQDTLHFKSPFPSRLPHWSLEPSETPEERNHSPGKK
jgi:hypothetical protein